VAWLVHLRRDKSGEHGDLEAMVAQMHDYTQILPWTDGESLLLRSHHNSGIK
jgi:hypothetical protein